VTQSEEDVTRAKAARREKSGRDESKKHATPNRREGADRHADPDEVAARCDHPVEATPPPTQPSSCQKRRRPEETIVLPKPGRSSRSRFPADEVSPPVAPPPPPRPSPVVGPACFLQNETCGGPGSFGTVHQICGIAAAAVAVVALMAWDLLARVRNRSKPENPPSRVELGHSSSISRRGRPLNRSGKADGKRLGAIAGEPRASSSLRR